MQYIVKLPISPHLYFNNLPHNELMDQMRDFELTLCNCSLYIYIGRSFTKWVKPSDIL